MSDSLTEIMKEMRNQPPPTPEALAAITKRERDQKVNEEARKEAMELYLYTLLGGDFSRSINEMEFFSREDLLHALRKLEREGKVENKDYRWKVKGQR